MDAIEPIDPRQNVPPNDSRSQSERVLAEVGPTLELLAQIHGWPPPADLIELWCDQLRRAGERLEELQLPVHVAALSDFQVDPAGQLYWIRLPHRIEETRRGLAWENSLPKESDDYFQEQLWAHSTPQLIEKLQNQLRRVDVGISNCLASSVAGHKVSSVAGHNAPSFPGDQMSIVVSHQRPELSTRPLARRQKEKQGGRTTWRRASWIAAGALGCACAGILISMFWDGTEVPPGRVGQVQEVAVASIDKDAETDTKLETVLGNESEFDLETELGEGAGIESLMGPAGAFDEVIASVEPLPEIAAADGAAEVAFPDLPFPSDSPPGLANVPKAEGLPEAEVVPDAPMVDESPEVQEGGPGDLVDFHLKFQRPRQRQQRVHKFPSTIKLADLRLEIVPTNQETPLHIDWLVPMQPVAARRARGIVEIRFAPGDPLALRVQLQMTLQRSLTLETVAAVSQLVPNAASEPVAEVLLPAETGWTLAGSEQASAAVAAMDIWLERYPVALAMVRERIGNTNDSELRSQLRKQRYSLESQAKLVKELREQTGRLQQLFTRCEQELLLQIRSGLR